MSNGSLNSLIRMNAHGSQRGFSVVEIMIALVASLIVVGSVLAFTVSTVQSNTENVQATRLSQDLRAVMNLMTRELRRAGYDDNFMEGIGRGTGYVSPFSQMQVVAGVDNGCFTIAYDKAGDPATTAPGRIDPGNGELRAYRRTEVNGVGVLQMLTGANASCDQANGWEALTDPQLSNIESFTLTLTEGAAGNASTPLRVRDVSIELRGSVVGRAEIVREMDARVRVRADCIRDLADIDDCNAAPSP